MATDKDRAYGLWRSGYKAVGLLVFVLILGPIALPFRWSGHWDLFKRYEVLIAVVVAVPGSIGVLEATERLAFGRSYRERCRFFEGRGGRRGDCGRRIGHLQRLVRHTVAVRRGQQGSGRVSKSRPTDR